VKKVRYGEEIKKLDLKRIKKRRWMNGWGKNASAPSYIMGNKIGLNFRVIDYGLGPCIIRCDLNI